MLYIFDDLDMNYIKRAVLFAAFIMPFCLPVSVRAASYDAEAVADDNAAVSDSVNRAVTVTYDKFVNEMLPATVRALTVSPESRESIADPAWLVYQITNAYMACVDRDLSAITARTMDGGYVVWTMPKPRKEGEPKYIGFVPDGSGYRVMTLEKSFLLYGTEIYELCEAINDPEGIADHINYDIQLAGNCTVKQFAKAVHGMLSVEKALSNKSH